MGQSKSGSAVADAGPAEFPDARRAWYVVILLTLLYALSFTDRLLLALLAQPVASALTLTDGQLALLLGAGFAIVYALSGLPIADRIDRNDRVKIVVAGVALWSVMTMASAFASNFWTLFALRSGVALGEAVLTPAAVSLIGDLFPQKRRAVPTAVYGSMGSMMSTGAFVIGGAVLAFSGTIDHKVGLAAWQLTFIFLGCPGLLIAFLMLFTVKDPRHAPQANTTKLAGMTFVEMLGYLRGRSGFYLAFYLGLALITTVSMGTISWMPTAIVRNFGGSVQQAGYQVGAMGLTAGILSTIFWPWLAQWLAGKGRKDGTLIGLLASGAIAVAALVLGIGQSSLNLVLGAFFVAMFGLASVGVLAPLALQMFGPRMIRARLTSLYILATSLFGYALGPLVVVGLAKFWTGPNALIHGMIVNAALAGGLSCLAFLLCLKASRRMDHQPD
ncbi:putative glucarate transporter [Brevundimonas sp. SH203]|uniref:MFS transporter n=1 Tax=Brevundimonas sp. SH203 TaxID=345167 RepID=UPI0009D15178|nr:MFS transporter [Brevundimonas sp. SH203]GAW40285.1 putative glucarate transporter [Brevundimonas sp. SH203]